MGSSALGAAPTLSIGGSLVGAARTLAMEAARA